MKKLLVLLMVVAAMVFVVNAAMADVKDPVLVDGKVEITWNSGSGNGFAGTTAGNIKFDCTKDFGSGISAGFTILAKPGENVAVPGTLLLPYEPLEAPAGAVTTGEVAGDADGDGINEIYYIVPVITTGIDGANSVMIDGDGWIKMDYKTLVVEAKTGGLGGNVGNAVTPGITGAAGVKFTVLPIDGITGTVVLSGPNDGVYDLVGAKYSKDGITVGGGYQLDGAFDGTNATGFAAFAGYKKDAIGVDAEFCKLNNLMAYYGAASYSAGSLAVDAAVLGKDTTTYAYGDDEDTWSAYTTFRRATVSGLAAKGHAKLTMGAIWGEAFGQYTTGTGLESLSYKVAAGAGFGDLSVSAYFRGYASTEAEGKVEYKLVPDKLKGWAEVLYTNEVAVKCGLVYTPVGGIEASTEVNVLDQVASAKLTATF